ncbi:MAG: restriction endonuclease [Armatimonadota bacterium]
MNAELAARLTDLGQVLPQTLEVDDTISFDSLRLHDTFPAFTPPSDLARSLPAPELASFVRNLRQRTWVHKVFPPAERARLQALAAARRQHEEASSRHAEMERSRKERLRAAEAEHRERHAAFLQKVAQRSQEIEELEKAYGSGDAEAVTAYCSMVLERSSYPEGFPHEFRLAYVPESRELVVEYELPTPDVVPDKAEYRYVKARDEITSKARKAGEISEIYADVVSAVALRTLHELFESDQGKHIESCVFNGVVQTVDPATGQGIHPCLISVRATKQSFLGLDLSRVDKKSCLRNLGASVSTKPRDIVPVRPVLEFDMVDRRFVEHSDLLGDLDARPNLMDLNPYEFENLVVNLFESMGLESKLTRTGRDGGVDAVVYDPRPVLGGKVVVQAKRYRDTVGVSAVRDLYGTMMNEGANKGILVTTSGYGPDALEFVKDKPIELIAGGQLLYLLEQHAGVRAHIIFPEETSASP